MLCFLDHLTVFTAFLCGFAGSIGLLVAIVYILASHAPLDVGPHIPGV